MMRRLLRFVCFAALLAPPQAYAAGALSPDGNWTRDDGTTRMTVAPCGGQVCAVNTWVKDPNGNERVGDKLVMTLRQTSPTVLSGKAFDVRRNRDYSITITLTGNGMKTSGCVLLGVVCRSTVWARDS